MLRRRRGGMLPAHSCSSSWGFDQQYRCHRHEAGCNIDAINKKETCLYDLARNKNAGINQGTRSGPANMQGSLLEMCALQDLVPWSPGLATVSLWMIRGGSNSFATLPQIFFWDDMDSTSTAKDVLNHICHIIIHHLRLIRYLSP